MLLRIWLFLVGWTQRHGAYFTAAATAFGIGFSIYVEFIRDRNPALVFEVLSEISVVEIRESVGGLAVMYEGQDIRKERLALRVLLVRLANRGVGSIAKSAFDERAPLRLRIAGATVIRAEIVESSNDYLRSVPALHPSADFLTIGAVTMEPGDWVSLKVLFLNPINSAPSLSVNGKVSGVRDIVLIPPVAADDSYFEQVLSGDWRVHVSRLIVYPAILVVLILAVADLSIRLRGRIRGVRSRWRRRQIIKFFKSVHAGGHPAYEELFKQYEKYGLFFLVCLADRLDEMKQGQPLSDGFIQHFLQRAGYMGGDKLVDNQLRDVVRSLLAEATKGTWADYAPQMPALAKRG